ncbi:MAG: molybdate ABC transporter permease subunit [Pseudomonadales bacterium]|nr:molybdate ABC transporter permease subunit [Pseudomonadales bacterium]
MGLNADDWSAIYLTVKLASLSTILLLLLAIPLAWWLARTHSRLKRPLSVLVTLPMVLPPTVLGFYLLVLLGPQGLIGQLTQSLGWGLLPFSFSGMVIGSMLYSLPFAVQPLQQSFEAMGDWPMEVAATLRASPGDVFFSVVLPMARSGLVSAAVMSFAHTVGEFGVILMIGGNIPDKTRVLSIQIYNHVEAMEYAQGHWLAGGLLVFSFAVLWTLHHFKPTADRLISS